MLSVKQLGRCRHLGASRDSVGGKDFLLKELMKRDSQSNRLRLIEKAVERKAVSIE